MARNTSVTLGGHFTNFVDQQLQQGRFCNVSEVVRAGLRLLEDEETKRGALRAALLAGEASGPAIGMSSSASLYRAALDTAGRRGQRTSNSVRLG